MIRTILTATLLFSLVGTSRADDSPQPDHTALRAALAKQRQENLKRFHEYRVKGIYPHNLYEPGAMNVWKDPQDHLCAIATLVDEAGLKDLVEKTAKDQNFVKIAELEQGPLVDWILTSGLTQEEAVMIQQPTEADVEEMEAQERREKRKLARKLKREDERLATNYIAVERALKQPRIADAGLDVAVARLAAHPELAKKLLGQ
jgi:hypothetical protein